MPFWVCRWLMAAGKRPVPFRTRKLSPPALMVLLPGGSGRVGYRRRVKLDMLWHPPPHLFPLWGLVWWRVLFRLYAAGGVVSVDTARCWPGVMRAGLPVHVNFCTGPENVDRAGELAAVWVSPKPKRRGSRVHNLLRAVNGSVACSRCGMQNARNRVRLRAKTGGAACV